MAIKYVPYFPNTLEGQAILDNFVRTKRVLRYRDNDQLIERVERGMPLYEMETKETIGTNPNQNKIIRGECLSACAYLEEQGIQVDLVYIDPPFASGADYAKKVYIRRNPLVAKAIEQAESELDVEELKAFEEKMYGGVWDKGRYLNWMYENLMAIKSVMSEAASIYVHLDYHIGHYVKILLDEIFGEDNFRNEIIWQRANAHSDAKQGAVHYGRMHDVIFYYVTNDSVPLNMQYTPYDQAYIDKYYNNIEESTGRRYWLDNIQGPGGASKGNPYYEVMGVTRYWRYSRETMQKLIEEGRIVQTAPGTVPKYKRYLDEMPGKPMQDIWSDVKSLGGLGSLVNEREDYATQKPEA